MLMSSREAADLGFQMMLAVAAVVCGMALANVLLQSRQVSKRSLDIGRPVLWTATPVRIDRQDGSVASAAAPGKSESSVCIDNIGLRLACDLIALSGRSS